ncbi:MAG: GGDEF domain-containing protein [Candidatus Brocadiae bacterium]|nr:GGDEF domain-containing protein [Candidatus Brocadiia bacterium]
MRRRIAWFLVFATLPAATFALATIWQMSDEYQAQENRGGVVPFLAAFAALTAVYALVLGLLLALAGRREKELKDEAHGYLEAGREAARSKRDLERRVEFLSAAREMILVLREEVEFSAIARRVLGFVAHAAGASEMGMVGIYVFEEEKLQLRALWRDGEAMLEPRKISAAKIDPASAAEAFEQKRLVTRASQTQLRFSIPITADRETIGALQVEVAAEGDPAERGALVKRLEGELYELMNFVALAIKTPDLYERTIRDGMTKLFTKRHFTNQLAHHAAIAQRHGEPLALIMVDVDHFKSVNDTYGHLTGDMVLKEVAKVVRDSIRSSNEAYRYGGEEMGVLCPETTAEQAAQLAERLRKKLEGRMIQGETKKLSVTASFGVSEWSADMKAPEDLVSRADEALYVAKKSGRNQVQSWKAGALEAVKEKERAAAH